MADEEATEKKTVPMEETKRTGFFKYHYKGLLLVVLPILFCPILFGPQLLPYRYLYVMFVVFSFFLLNVMPVGAVAFIVCVSIPLLGIEASKKLCVAYYGDVMFQFFASMMLGVMMDASKMSIWLAYIFMAIFGSGIRRIQVGLMLITTLFSLLWPTILIAAIMMRVAMAIMTELNSQGVINMNSDEEPYEYNSKPYPSWIAIGIYLTVAYSAVIGAFCSPLNSPNSVLFILFKIYMPDNAKSMGFGSTFLLMGPVMIIELIVVCLWIQFLFLGLARPKSAIGTEISSASAASAEVKDVIKTKKEELGGCTSHLIFATMCMVLAMLLVLFRKPILFSGLADLLEKKLIEPSCFLMLMCVVAFMIPANCLFIRYCTCYAPSKVGTAPSLLSWKAVNVNTCWNHAYYLGCGIAVVHCGFVSGFYKLVCESFVRAYVKNKSLGTMELYSALFGIIASIFSPSDSLAKVATPMLFKLGHQLSIGGGRLAVPFSMALHPSFMFPSGSGPAAIVAGWGNIRTWQMFLVGTVPTIIGFLLVYLFYAVLAETAFPGYTNYQESLNLTLLEPPTTPKK